LGSDPQRIRAETTDLIARKPEVVVSGTSVAVAQILQTSAIPVVFAGITDPVSQGFVKSLARPDSNATGFAAYEVSLGGKWIETLKELWPRLGRAAVLYEPTTAPYMPDILRSIVEAGPSFEVQIDDLQIRNIEELDSALALLGQQPNAGVIVPPASFTNTHSSLLVALAAKYRLPTIYAFRNRGRRPDLLWRRWQRSLDQGSGVCGPSPPWRQAKRLASADSDQVRIGDQPQDS
jgi:putative tryptophan/tyrosine transport system substrate-binding protein